jgi:hypothetical protein
MTKTSITLAFSLLTMGCGKKTNEAVCEDACSDLVSAMDRCVPELELNEVDCNTGCLSQLEGDSCPDEYRALYICYDNTNMDAISCDSESPICVSQQAALNTCIGAVDSPDWDSGDWDWDTGEWEWDTGW